MSILFSGKKEAYFKLLSTDFLRILRVKDVKQSKGMPYMVLFRLEHRTFSVQSRRNNHYTTEPDAWTVCHIFPWSKSKYCYSLKVKCNMTSEEMEIQSCSKDGYRNIYMIRHKIPTEANG